MKFKEYLLKDIATITMGQSPKSQFYNEDGKGIEFLQGVRTFGEDFPYFDTYTTKYNRLAYKNSILFSVRAPVGRVNWATKNIAIGRGVASISVKNMVYDRYVYYYFKKMGSFYDKKATGTVFTSINKKELESLKIKVPASYDDQKRIADRLATLDRKIHLNQQLNANLDEIKTAYFDKSFNQQMQSNLNGKLKNITKITSGKRPNKKSDTKSSKDKYPIVGASKVMGYTDNYLYNEPILTTGRVGTHGIIQRFREPVWVSDNSFVFKTDHEDYLFEILNHWINYSALNRGSTQPLITQTDLKNIDIYVPTESELKKFEMVSRILTNLQFSLIKQNRRLDQIKKTLLNKLLL